MRKAFCLLLLSSLVALGCNRRQPPANTEWLPKERIPYQPFWGKDSTLEERKQTGVPPLRDFPIKPVAEVTDELRPDEIVMGVTINGESRAYVPNQLTGPDREILNDVVGGQPIAATW